MRAILAAVGAAFGRYELLERIAAGGMGEVFRARAYGDEGFVKDLAIKRIHPEASDDPTFRALFVEEARIAVLLAHGNVVQVFDFGHTEAGLFLVMEWIDGPDLGALMKTGPLPLEVALFITSEVLQGLDYAYRQPGRDGTPLRLIHRDIKPANVLLSRQGEVKIADFGLARPLTGALAATSGQVWGTPGYMSPEQAAGLPLDARSDVFAVGCVLQEMLTGRRLFEGRNDDEALARTLKGSFELQAPDEGIAALLRRSVNPDPGQRFPDSAAFLDAIEELAVERRMKLGGRALAELIARRSLPAAQRRAAAATTVLRRRGDAGLPEFATEIAPPPEQTRAMRPYRRWLTAALAGGASIAAVAVALHAHTIGARRDAEADGAPTPCDRCEIQSALGRLTRGTSEQAPSGKVNARNGNLWLTHLDYSLPSGHRSPLEIMRNYNSRSQASGLFGFGWSTAYDVHVTVTRDGRPAILGADGKQLDFSPVAAGTFQADGSPGERLDLRGDGYRRTLESGVVQRFSADGRLQEILDPDGHSITLQHSQGASGPLSAIVDSDGARLVVTSDSAGRILRISDPEGRTIQYVYDRFGNLVEVRDADGGDTRYEYDEFSNLTRVVFPDHDEITCQYDVDKDWVLAVRRPGGQVEAYEYGGAPDGSDDWTLAHADGRTTRYDYFDAGRTFRRTDPDGRVVVDSFDPSGHLIEASDNRGRRVRYEYDHSNAIRAVIGSASTTSLTYDGSGNMAEAVRDDGKRVRLTWSGGKVVAIDGNRGEDYDLGYNQAGELIRIHPRSGTGAVVLEYGPIGEVTTVRSEGDIDADQTLSSVKALLDLIDPALNPGV